MTPRTAAAVMAWLLASAHATAIAEPVQYVLDPARSWVQFELLHFGTSTIRGRLGPAQGVVTLDRAQRSGSVSIELPAASVDSGFKPFDARIRQPDLLATESHPRIWFIGSTLRFDGEQLAAVRGELTLRDTSQGLTLTAERFTCRLPPPPEREVCGGDFTGSLRRSDFGITFGLPFVGDAVRLSVQVEAVRVPEITPR